MKSTVLELKEISKRFGGLQVIDRINLKFNREELRCIIVSNGAGKTTLFNLITGGIKPDAGQVIFESEDITHLKPYQISRAGIARKFQVPTVFDKQSILENLGIAAWGHQGIGSFILSRWNKSAVLDQVQEIMEVVHLGGREDETVGTLSHGEKQWLEIGIVLAYRPKLMLLDEPTAGMNPQETMETSRIIRKISQEVTTVVIEHDIKFLKEIAEFVTVLHQGAVLAEGTFTEMENNPIVRDVYLGRKD